MSSSSSTCNTQLFDWKWDLWLNHISCFVVSVVIISFITILCQAGWGGRRRQYHNNSLETEFRESKFYERSTTTIKLILNNNGSSWSPVAWFRWNNQENTLKFKSAAPCCLGNRASNEPSRRLREVLQPWRRSLLGAFTFHIEDTMKGPLTNDVTTLKTVTKGHQKRLWMMKNPTIWGNPSKTGLSGSH